MDELEYLVDYPYYQARFPQVTQEEFNKNIYRSQLYVSKRVNVDINTLSSDFDIKDCICEVLNEVYMFNRNKGVSSVSNSGYSESYVDSTDDKIDEIIEYYLSNKPYFISQWVVF